MHDNQDAQTPKATHCGSIRGAAQGGEAAESDARTCGHQGWSGGGRGVAADGQGAREAREDAPWQAEVGAAQHHEGSNRFNTVTCVCVNFASMRKENREKKRPAASTAPAARATASRRLREGQGASERAAEVSRRRRPPACIVLQGLGGAVSPGHFLQALLASGCAGQARLFHASFCLFNKD